MHSVRLDACLLALCWAMSASAVEPNANKSEPQRHIAPALGLSESLGRWKDPIKLGYNPLGAHSAFADNSYFIRLLTEAAGRWEKVSGVRFEIVPVGNYSAEGPNSLSEVDGIVSVFWTDSDQNFLGRAGPVWGAYSETLGYFPYLDGTIELNSRLTHGHEADILRTLTHELGHLIGLGHSENPLSLMFANPYNEIHYPFEDDIRATQTLYGPPDTALATNVPVPDWIYQDSTEISSLKPLFRDLKLLIGDQELLQGNVIDHTFPGDKYLTQRLVLGNTGSDDLSIETEIVIIDPNGYFYKQLPLQANCKAGYICTFVNHLIASTLLKQMAGTWRINLYEVNNQKRSLVHTRLFSVESAAYNKPPAARVVVQPISETTVNMRVIAVDEEADDIYVTWNPDQSPELLVNGISSWRTVDLAVKHGNSLYIQVNDSSERYNALASSVHAGKGFQTLLRADIKHPFYSHDSIAITSSSSWTGNDRATELLLHLPTYISSDGWPSPYHGVTPPQNMNLAVNNISTVNLASARIFSCVQILSNGQKSQLNGVERFDIVFRINNFDRGEIQVIQSRIFNQINALNEYYEPPDCSGSYELTSGLYTDIVELGSDIFRVEFNLSDEAGLIFKLSDAVRLE